MKALLECLCAIEQLSFHNNTSIEAEYGALKVVKLLNRKDVSFLKVGYIVCFICLLSHNLLNIKTIT